jgi:hypothetical protein
LNDRVFYFSSGGVKIMSVKLTYRQIYQKQTIIKIPKYFDVHHLDRKRENNHILNLLALPKKLHHSYHWHLNYFLCTHENPHYTNVVDRLSMKINFTPDNDPSFNYHYTIKDCLNIELLSKMFAIIEEMEKWVSIRNYYLSFSMEYKNKFKSYQDSIHETYLDSDEKIVMKNLYNLYLK